jgi:hypothetical protein
MPDAPQPGEKGGSAVLGFWWRKVQESMQLLPKNREVMKSSGQ